MLAESPKPEFILFESISALLSNEVISLKFNNKPSLEKDLEKIEFKVSEDK